MSSSLSRFGGFSSRSLLSTQRTLTPILSSTSSNRFTSSILGMSSMIVVPLLRSEPARIATAAFLDGRMVISPCSSWPPSTRRLMALPVIEIMGLFRTSLIRPSVSRLRFWLPCSIRLTADWLVPSFLANSACVMPRSCRI